MSSASSVSVSVFQHVFPITESPSNMLVCRSYLETGEGLSQSLFLSLGTRL